MQRTDRPLANGCVRDKTAIKMQATLISLQNNKISKSLLEKLFGNLGWMKVLVSVLDNNLGKNLSPTGWEIFLRKFVRL